MVGRKMRAFTMRTLSPGKRLSASMVLWLEGRIVLYAVGSIDERDVCRSHLSLSKRPKPETAVTTTGHSGKQSVL